MATEFTPAQRSALEHLAMPAPATRPELQGYSDWRFERNSDWRLIPGVASQTRKWLVREGYAVQHPDIYYAYRLTDLGRDATASSAVTHEQSK